MFVTSDMSFEDSIKIFIIAFRLQENATEIPKFMLSDYVETNKQTNKQTDTQKHNDNNNNCRI